jgi:hypothetical protein
MTMSATPTAATIFAYQVGFGDCFLVRFSYADGSMRHMLIDFGTTGLPEHVAGKHMLVVARDIEAKCKEGNGGLDLVVATHRHADHISGFATSKGKGSGDVIASLNPRAVIQPWTEAPDAPTDWLGPEDSAGKPAFRRHRASLAAMHEAAEAALRYLARNASKMPHAIARELAFIGEDNLSNLSAVRNLLKMSARNLYVFHGCGLDLSAELPGIDVKVLGPPTLKQTETIRKQRSKDEDEFWHLARKSLSDANNIDGKASLFPNARTISGKRLYAEQRWLAKRIDECNGELVLSLVRALDKQMNNTSVILLVKAGSKSMLFPGDAQIENWRYALQSEFAPLLDDVDLYKVGHHGSLNATPKSLWNRFAKRGPKSMKNRMTSVLSTRQGKHGNKDKNTEVPRRSLVTELDAKSNLVSTETLADHALYKEVRITLS